VHGADGYRLKASNPTPYFVNLGSLQLVSGGQTVDVGPGYVAPGESQEFPLTRLKGAPQPGSQLKFRVINEFGAGVPGEAALAT
jgi:chaperone protein EcpD